MRSVKYKLMNPFYLYLRQISILTLTILAIGCGSKSSSSSREDSQVDGSFECSLNDGTCDLYVQSPQSGAMVGSHVLVEGTCDEGTTILIENSHLVENPTEIHCIVSGIFGGYFSSSINFASDSEGNQILSFSLRDPLDRVAFVGTINVTVDQTPPTQPIISNPISGSIFNTLSPTVTGTCEGDLVNVSGSNLVTSPVTGVCLFGFFNIPVTFVPGSQGSQTLSAASTDAAGNESAFASVTFTIDTTTSSVTVNQTVGQLDPTNTLPISFDVVFNENISVDTFTIDDVIQSGTATGITWQISETGNDKKFKLKAIAITGEGTLAPSILGGSILDIAGNLNASSTSTDNIVTYETSQPTVTIEQAITQVDPTSVLPIEFSVEFSEPINVSTFTSGDIEQNGTAAGVSWNILDSGDHVHFTVQAVSAVNDGTVEPRIDASSIQDLAGNLNTASTSIDANVTWDATGSSVTIEQSASQIDPTRDLPISFDITFSDAIDTSTLSTDDIVQNGTATDVTWNIIDLGDQIHFTLQAVSASTDGSILPSLDAGTVSDLLGNPNEASSSMDNIVWLDFTSPSISIEQSASQADPTNTLPIEFSISFDEMINTATFTIDDIQQTGTAGTVTWTLIDLGDGRNFTLIAESADTNGTVIPSIAAGSVQDLIGNDNLASSGLDNVVLFDDTLPSAPECIFVADDATTTDSVTVTWNGSIDEGSGIDHYEMSIGLLDIADIIGWTNIGISTEPYRFTSISPELLFDTDYTTYIRAIDVVGNISAVTACPAWQVHSE